MEQDIIASCVRRRIPLPDKIADAPRILTGLEPYYIAFWELSTDRPSGFGAGQIPWSSIDRYAAREGMGHDEYLDLIDMIRAMDRAFLAYSKEKQAEREAAAEARRKQPIGSRRGR